MFVKTVLIQKGTHPKRYSSKRVLIHQGDLCEIEKNISLSALCKIGTEIGKKTEKGNI